MQTNNVRHAGRRVLERSLPMAKNEGVLADVFTMLWNQEDIDWQHESGGAPLWERTLDALFGTDIVRPGIAQAHELLYGLFQRAGLDLSFSSPVLKKALGLPLDGFVLKAAQSQPPSAVEVARMKQEIPSSFVFIDDEAVRKGRCRFSSLYKSWRSNSTLLSVLRAWDKEVEENRWMGSLDVLSLRKDYPNFCWDEDKALKFVRLRLLPDLKGGATSSTRLRAALDISYFAPVTQDKKALLDVLSPAKLIALLSSMREHAPRDYAPGLIPRMIERSNNRDMFKSEYAFQDATTAWLLDEVEVLRKGNPLIFKDSEKSYWRAMGGHLETIGLKTLDWGLLSASQEVLSRINNHWAPSKRLVTELTQCLPAASLECLDPPSWPSSDNTFLPHVVVLAAWISALPSPGWERMLSNWKKYQTALTIVHPEIAMECHGILASGVLLRVLRAQDPPELWKQNHATFWSHFLRSSPSGMYKLSQRIQQSGSPGRPDVFDLQQRDPVVMEALEGFDPKSLNTSNERKSFIAKVVLDLNARLVSSKAPTVKPRM